KRRRADFHSQRLDASVVVGAALSTAAGTALELIASAEDAARRAGHKGRHEVVAAWQRDSQPSRPPVDAELMLGRVLTRGGFGALLAFEMEDDAGVLSRYGSATRDKWFKELAACISDVAATDESVGVWRGRYLLLALRDGRASDAGAIA